MKQPYLECGKIINAHGVRGCVKIESYCDTPDILASLRRIFLKDQNGNFTAREVRKASVGKGKVLATLEGIDDLDTAILYKNTIIYAAREDLPLPKGAHFIADMIGLPVFDADSGRRYGSLKMVEAMPSSSSRSLSEASPWMIKAPGSFSANSLTISSSMTQCPSL